MRVVKLSLILLGLTFGGTSCAANYSAAQPTTGSSSLSSTRAIPRHVSGEPMPFFASDDAKADLQATLNKAALSGKKPLVVMGANWCHDSRALAAHFEKSRFTSLLRAHYEPVYIDVGQKDRNVDIAQYYGYAPIVGTPTVIILSPQGELLNRTTAPTWRNAASRSEREVYEYFRAFARGREAE
ncbi:MAG: thioredoxin family protein [Maricaulaceae bacterium]